MRFKEFAEATTPIGPNASWVQNGAAGHTVFTEPWDAEKEKRDSEGIYMQDLKLPNGSLPPEITALKGTDGQYDISRATSTFAEQLLRKYKNISYFRWQEPGPNDTQYDRDSRAKDIKDLKDTIVKALTSANEGGTPKSRYYYPNRPQADNALQGFRGTPTGVENTAKKFDPSDINFYMGAYKWARNKRLLDPVSAEEWLMIMLTEGRDDFGFNIGQWLQQQGPGDKAFAEQLKQMGLTNSSQIGFIGLTKSKQNLIKQGSYKDFYAAWNGGTANMANFKAQQMAVADPRNKPILDLIKQAIA